MGLRFGHQEGDLPFGPGSCGEVLTDWARHDHKPEPAKREPRLELIEVCWRVVGPSTHVIECSIYRTDAGLEVRVGYSIEYLLRSQFASEIGTARDIAAAWTRAIVEKGFTEIT